MNLLKATGARTIEQLSYIGGHHCPSGRMHGWLPRNRAPEGVGRSATSAVVRSTFLVIFADLFITTMFYLLNRT